MNETREERALLIASIVIQMLGGCARNDPSKCRKRHGPFQDEACEECIRQWLLKRADKELAGQTAVRGGEN